MSGEANPCPSPGKRLVIAISSHGSPALKRSFPPGIEVSLGRDTRCHLVLPSTLVSRQHLRLRLIEGGLEVTDLSRAGTPSAHGLLHHETRIFPTGPFETSLGPYSIAAHVSERHEQSAGVRREIHGQLLQRLNLEKRKWGAEVSSALRIEVADALRDLVADPIFSVPAHDQARIASELQDEALGLGPLEALLADEGVSEIMVVDAKSIYAERSGKVELTGRAFTDDEAVRSAIERIVTPLGRRVDESSPLVDARLADGSRVNAVIPPLALRGPCITIRKFPTRRLQMQDLIESGSLSARMARFLERSVALKKNIVISGGTGSGKTTLLNLLSASIGSAERVVTIEDAAELSLNQNHVVSLEAKTANLEGKGEISIRELVKNALRMRPDRIVVGECRGGEALDMLQAMNTGHEGSMTTTHANSPKQALGRLETLCLMSGLELPLAAIRRQMAASLHLIVQQSRLADGSRKVTQISEVIGLSESGEIELRSLFEMRSFEGCDGLQHIATGFMPTFLPELALHLGAGEGAAF